MKAIFVTVRTASARLPKKCLLDLGGKSVLSFLLGRLRRSQHAQAIVVCTTANNEDDAIERIADAESALCFRGSECDKLERWRGAADQFGVEFFVTADADDPFCEPELIDMAFAQHDRTNADFIHAEGLAVGAFTYGIKTAALRKVCEIKDTDDTEMMWPYFMETGLFNVELLKDVPETFHRPDFRMTLDYPEDYRFFQTVVNHFQNSGDPDFTLRDTIEYLSDHSEVVDINRHRQEEFLQNQKSKSFLKLKQAPR